MPYTTKWMEKPKYMYKENAKHNMAGNETHSYYSMKIPACTLPVVQLLMTKCVVDIHYIPCKEHDDPQSNK